ncbi:hypothetical protein BKA66DRAFT_104310 [Pyrenochaeta sp. MPI-SDFR-AT-0127]|nr:hypothetical protein BKA66DRAFT_104310 [Pyrenochaeta sp. MPI-SDFR-AT-0127]
MTHSKCSTLRCTVTHIFQRPLFWNSKSREMPSMSIRHLVSHEAIGAICTVLSSTTPSVEPDRSSRKLLLTAKLAVQYLSCNATFSIWEGTWSGSRIFSFGMEGFSHLDSYANTSVFVQLTLRSSKKASDWWKTIPSNVEHSVLVGLGMVTTTKHIHRRFAKYEEGDVTIFVAPQLSYCNQRTFRHVPKNYRTVATLHTTVLTHTILYNDPLYSLKTQNCASNLLLGIRVSQGLRHVNTLCTPEPRAGHKNTFSLCTRSSWCII